MSYTLAQRTRTMLHKSTALDPGPNGFSNPLGRVARASAYKMASLLPTNWLEWMRGKSMLRDVLNTLSIDCVIDVGANRGQYGLTLRGLGYAKDIISFEPVESNLESLRKTAARNQPWRVFPYALGNTDGSAEINVTTNTVFSSLLTPDDESRSRFPANRTDRRETVEIRRLENVLEECLRGIAASRLYLKLDTQGFDLEVLRGAASVLPRVLALQTEVSFRSIYHAMHDFTESIAEFRACGFEVVDFLPGVRDIDHLSAIEMDCIMARRPQWGVRH